MLDLAEQTNTPLIAWKEFNPSQDISKFLKQLGYKNLPTLPDNIIHLPGDGVGGFIESLKSSYKRKYKRAVTLFTKKNILDNDQIPRIHWRT